MRGETLKDGINHFTDLRFVVVVVGLPFKIPVPDNYFGTYFVLF